MTKGQDVKRCFCAQNSPGFLLYQLDISKLFLLPADLATNTPGGQAVSLAAHLPQYWSAWWAADIRYIPLRACCNTLMKL